MRRLLPLFAFGALVVFQAMPAYAADGDGDNVADEVDVCPTVSDPFQGDLDGDGVGDVCESSTTGVSSFDGTPEGELIIGTNGTDTLAGAGGADAIYGLDGDDSLDGGDGRDFLSGGPGVDTLSGGPGCDVFAFDPSGDDDVITDFNPAVDRMSFPSPAEATDVDPLANATYGGDDYLVVTFGEGDNSGSLDFQGLPAGVELVLTTGPCFTPPADEEIIPPVVIPPVVIPPVVIPPVVIPPGEPPFVCSPIFGDLDPDALFEIELPFDGKQVFGTDGDDTLTGTDCSDVIVGDAAIGIDPEAPPIDPEEQTCPDDVCGDDIINALGGNDYIIGDKPVLTGQELGGDDTIHGGGGDDIIVGDTEVIFGCLCGELGDGDSIFVEPDGPAGGDDELYGDDGHDLIIGDAVILSGEAYGGHDSLYGGDGRDLLVGDGFTIEAGATAGNDYLNGGAGNDDIYGDALIGVDSLSVAGDDTLVGGAGDDFLVGDTELMDGQAGHDTFVYDANADFGDDIIADAGSREVTDIVQFSGTGLTDIASLDLRSTLFDDGTDVVATVFTDSGKGTSIGSITLWGHGFFVGATTWADIDAVGLIDVVIV